MAHMRHILAPGAEVRQVAASTVGVGFDLDSPSGERGADLVHFSCAPTSPEEGQDEGGWNILACLESGQFVGEWVAQGESLEADWHAAWLAVMANCSGRGYWLRGLEAEEGLE